MPLDKSTVEKGLEDQVQFPYVPVVIVTKDNFSSLEPTIRSAIEQCDYIAIDCEFSGLGDRKKLNDSSIEERFTNSSLVAKTRSIIGLGLSLFKEIFNDGCEATSKMYHVQTYNIIVLCSEDYIVEPGSLKFLLEHGFDFNQQYSKGVPYYRGNDKGEASIEENRLRNLFLEIIRKKKKIVLHNGFIDIVFLYQNLYAQLPQTLQTFLADLCEMFPAGIYDTKYIADYICRTQSSFLEFVYKSLLKTNAQRYAKSLTHTKIKFTKYPENYQFVEYAYCFSREVENGTNKDVSKLICEAYANHGNCPNQACTNSHDVDLILSSQEDKRRKKKRKRVEDKCESFEKSENGLGDNHEGQLNGAANLPDKNEIRTATSDGHRAGMDAFMTGYSYAAFISHMTNVVQDDLVLEDKIQDTNIVNKMYLVCKDIPLLIKKSSFAKNSVSHVEKYENAMT